MANTYLSQRDLIDIVTYEVVATYFGPELAIVLLPPHLEWVPDEWAAKSHRPFPLDPRAPRV